MRDKNYWCNWSTYGLFWRRDQISSEIRLLISLNIYYIINVIYGQKLIRCSISIVDLLILIVTYQYHGQQIKMEGWERFYVARKFTNQNILNWKAVHHIFDWFFQKHIIQSSIKNLHIILFDMFIKSLYFPFLKISTTLNLST